MKFSVKAKCPTIKKTITMATTTTIIKITKKITGPENKGFKKNHRQNVPPSLDFFRTGWQKKMCRIFLEVS
jgi:hypothetical protein